MCVYQKVQRSSSSKEKCTLAHNSLLCSLRFIYIYILCASHTENSVFDRRQRQLNISFEWHLSRLRRHHPQDQHPYTHTYARKAVASIRQHIYIYDGVEVSLPDGFTLNGYLTHTRRNPNMHAFSSSGARTFTFASLRSFLLALYVHASPLSLPAWYTTSRMPL